MVPDQHLTLGLKLGLENGYRLGRLFQALSADKPPGRRRKLSGEGIVLPVSIILRRMNRDPDISDAQHGKIRAGIDESTFGFSLATAHRQFRITQKGHYGLVPLGMLSSDILCVITGLSTPIVLRSVEEHYVVIRETCVLGYMNGQAVKEAESDNPESKTSEVH